jgi:hypothetical protein
VDIHGKQRAYGVFQPYRIDGFGGMGRKGFNPSKGEAIMVMNWVRNSLLSLVASAMALSPVFGMIQTGVARLGRTNGKKRTGFRTLIHRQGRV